jgi:hypothetical protein
MHNRPSFRMHASRSLALTVLIWAFGFSLASAQVPSTPSAPSAQTALMEFLVQYLREVGTCNPQGPCDPTPDKLERLKAMSEKTEQWSPIPPNVTLGAPGAPPSDAIVLFDGTNLDQWVDSHNHSPADWTVNGGILTVNKAAGDIKTKQKFGSYQLHLEWRIPKDITGEGQSRGNSGLFLAIPGPGLGNYEIQILDSWNNTTYVNGQAAALYMQVPPLVNASRPPGEWQTYDVIWHAPSFNADGSLKKRADVTIFHNGVLVQDHTLVKGETNLLDKMPNPHYDRAPIGLQSHPDPSESIDFRNIWLRPISNEE